MTLNTARPTGKTTLFCELIDELEATGAYFGILLDFEQLADFSGERFYERLSQMLNRWQPIEKPTAVVPHTMRDQGDFVDWLRATTLAVGRRVVLLIDEFDAIPMETVKALLSQFRAIESLSSAGEMDILAFYRNQRFIVETKVWYGQARFDQGKTQWLLTCQ